MQKETTFRGNKRKSNHGKAIKHMRELLNISQEGLGMMIGLSQRQIGNLETKQIVDQSKLAQIAEALNIPVKVFLNYDPQKMLQDLIQNIQENTYSDSSSNNNINELDTQNLTYSSNDPQFLLMHERMIHQLNTKIKNLTIELGIKNNHISELESEIKTLKSK